MNHSRRALKWARVAAATAAILLARLRHGHKGVETLLDSHSQIVRQTMATHVDSGEFDQESVRTLWIRSMASCYVLFPRIRRRMEQRWSRSANTWVTWRAASMGEIDPSDWSTLERLEEWAKDR